MAEGSALEMVDQTVHFVHPKTQQSCGFVSVQKSEYFAEVKAAQELNKQVCGNCYNYEYDGFVFVDELGERMRPDYLTSQFPAFIQRHGMKKMRFHDLRHSCASLLLANGVPLKQIQDWLGHSDFSTTANIYAHLDYSSKLSSAQAMVSGMKAR